MRFFERIKAAYQASVEKLGGYVSRIRCPPHHPYKKLNQITLIDGIRSIFFMRPS